MAVKSITITEDAYSRLAALKNENESFSDVVKRITGKRSLMDIAGVLSKKEAEKLEKSINEMRRGMKTRFAKTAQRLK